MTVFTISVAVKGYDNNNNNIYNNKQRNWTFARNAKKIFKVLPLYCQKFPHGKTWQIVELYKNFESPCKSRFKVRKGKFQQHLQYHFQHPVYHKENVYPCSDFYEVAKLSLIKSHF